MSCSDAFVFVLALACSAIGILIGIFITLCYRKVRCSVSPHQQRCHHCSNGNDNVVIGIQDQAPWNRRTNRTNPINRVTAEENDMGLFNALEVPAGDNRQDRLPRREGTHSPHQQPHHHDALAGSAQISGINNVNRSEIRPSVISSDRCGHLGDTFSTRRLSDGMTNDNCSVITTNIKDVGVKKMPFTAINARLALPRCENNESRQRNAVDNDSDLFVSDETMLKQLRGYDEDIMIIFKPCESSRTIMLREKKVVYICKMLDDRGGILELEHMGISLHVPAGSIPNNQRNLVTLVLNWDLNDNPPMEKKEALVSPVVYCGPHGSVFDKPCILKFKHCAYDTRYARIMTSPTDLFESKSWQDLDKIFEVSDKGFDRGDADEMPCLQAGVSLDVSECEVEVSHFSLFTCIMRSKHCMLKKWVQVAVFTHAIGPERMHQEIRVYFLNKTPCALQWAIQNEAAYDFSLACPDTTFLFMESGGNMMVNLSYLSDGWEAVAKDTDEPVRSVFFEEIWHGACPHVMMCFRKINRKMSSVSGMSEMDPNVMPLKYMADTESISATTSIETTPEVKDRIREYGSSAPECSEINIALHLKQECSENLNHVPLNVLVHNIKLAISDTNVKIIDEGQS